MHEFFEKFAINTKVNVVWGEMDALGLTSGDPEGSNS